MLTKDSKKRADWTEVFNYEITDNGEMYDVRTRSQKFESPKASTIASMTSTKSPYIKEEEEQFKRVRKVESPSHNDSKADKNFNKMNNLFMQEPNLR